MLNNTLPDVVVAGVLNNVSDVVQNRCRPVATVGAERVSNSWVAVSIEAQRLVRTQRRPGQCHVDRCRISLRCLQCAAQTLGILLAEDSLLIQLVVQRIGKEVAAGHKVGGAADRPVADDSNLCRAGRRCSQRHKACAVAVDRYRIVGRDRQQGIVAVHSNVACRQDFKREGIRAGAGCGKDHPPCHIVNWHAHNNPSLLKLY